MDNLCSVESDKAPLRSDPEKGTRGGSALDLGFGRALQPLQRQSGEDPLQGPRRPEPLAAGRTL